MSLLIMVSALTLILVASVQGQGYQGTTYPGAYSMDGSQMGDSAFYTGSAPPRSDMLVQVSPSQAVPAQQIATGNALWIADQSGTYHRTSISMPMYTWAMMKIVPAASGRLILHERYPGGTSRRDFMGHVRAGYTYVAWFSAGLLGASEVWYEVDGLGSNSVRFNVYTLDRSYYLPGYPYYSSYGPYTYSRYSTVGISTGARASY